MKLTLTLTLLLMTLINTTCASAGGIVVGGTRLIYDGGAKQSSINVSNTSAKPFLIQSWVDNYNNDKTNEFLITPPLFRLDGNESSTLRIFKTTDYLSKTQESLFWLNIKSIPSTNKDDDSNALYIAVKTKIKMIYRPPNVKKLGIPSDYAEDIVWYKDNNNITVKNNTPFVMNFYEVYLGNEKLKDINYILPMSERSFGIKKSSASEIKFKLINDYGGASVFFHKKITNK